MFAAPPGTRPEDLLDPGRLPAIFAGPLQYAFWVLVILGAHEMGHYLACRRYGIPATLPFFIPGIPPLGSFGAVIRIRGAIPHRKALFDIAAAGPLAGFAVALPVLAAGYLTVKPLAPAAEDMLGQLAFGHPLVLELFGMIVPRTGTVEINPLFLAGWVGMLVTSLNLFPVGQLDGGHAVYAISRRLHRALAYGVLLALLALVLYQALLLRQAPAYLLWFALLLYMRNRHPRLVDERTALGRGRTLVALLLALIFLLSFIPVPLTFVDG
jgi:membrane-associated protease RseP (regulator of RpoE activity)